MKIGLIENLNQAIFSTVSHSIFKTGVSFLFLLFSIFLISVNDLGAYAQAMAIIEIVVYVSGFGMSSSLSKFLVNANFNKNKIIIDSIFQSLLATLFSLIIIFLLYRQNIFPQSVYDLPGKIFYLSIFSTFGFNLSIIIRSCFFAEKKEMLGGSFKSILIFLQNIFSMLFYLFNKSLASLVFGYTFANLIMMFISLFVIFKIVVKAKNQNSLPKKSILEMIYVNFKNMVFSLQIYFLVQFPILLAIFLSFDTKFIGNLKMSLMIVNFFMIIPFSIEQAIIHRFHQMWIEGNKKLIANHFYKIVKKLINFFVPATIIVSSLFAIYFKFFNLNYSLTANIIMLYVLPFILISNSRILYATLISIDKEKYLISLLTLVFLGNLLASYLLKLVFAENAVIIGMFIPYLLFFYFLEKKVNKKIPGIDFANLNYNLMLWLFPFLFLFYSIAKFKLLLNLVIIFTIIAVILILNRKELLKMKDFIK